jgi:hypothetical protein
VLSNKALNRIFNNDRLSHWCVGAALAWAAYFVLFGLPIFHLWLGARIKTVATFFLILCVVHLAVTPWLFAARSTPQNPIGKPFKRGAAVIVVFTLDGLVVAYFMLRGSPHNPVSWGVFVAMPILLGVIFLAALALKLREKRAKEWLG